MTTNWSTNLRDEIEKLQVRYNGDNDLIPGAPVVTYSDNELLQMIRKLVRIVDDLQEQVDKLKGGGY